KILIALLVLIVALVGIGFLLPAEVSLERQTTIDANPATLYALTTGYTRFNEWSPWAEKDPNAVYEITGPHHGVGAKMAWKSEDPNVGVGSQEVVAAVPYERVETKLTFEGQPDALAFFDLEPAGEGTQVTWGFEGNMGNNPIGRWFGLFLDGLLGPDYERGLANLKQLAEGLSKADFADLDVVITEVESARIVYVGGTTSQDPAEIGPALGEAYGKVMAFVGEHGYEVAGRPLTVNKTWEDGVFEFEAGMPIAGGPEAAPEGSEVQVGDSYAGKVVRVVHTGAYDGLEDTYDKLEAYIAAHGLESAGPPWDVWVNDPEGIPEEELITHIHYPIQ
ncbi:MAG: SRPBCC family protein, partial [Holophagales bacterium]|nr:SRPBCC family protein [Holophagales bacterium]